MVNNKNRFERDDCFRLGETNQYCHTNILVYRQKNIRGETIGSLLF